MTKMGLVPIILLFYLCQSVFAYSAYTEDSYLQITQSMDIATPTKDVVEDAIIIPNSNPLYGLLASSIACFYTTEESSVLKPLLVQSKGVLTKAQNRFLETFLHENDGSLLVLGQPIQTQYVTKDLLGTPAEVALKTTQYIFNQTSAALIIPNSLNQYQLSLLASPLASYLNLPLLIYDNNSEELQHLCISLNVSNVFIIGNISLNLSNVTITHLHTPHEIQQTVLETIKEVFGEINYLTLTNPTDVIPPATLFSTNTSISDHITNTKIIILGKELDIIGTNIHTYSFIVPEGITRIHIKGIIPDTFGTDSLSFFKPVLFLSLTDPKGKLVAYSSSFALDSGTAYVETLSCNASGTYQLEVSMYRGIKGGYFSTRGLSFVDHDINLTITVSSLDSPHLPLLPKLSMIAPYLTAAHGGILLADPKFELTDNSYRLAAEGLATGPWYSEQLHEYTNEKVTYIIEQINETLEQVETYDLLDQYLAGPSWLGILAGANMVPMYYYAPSQQGIPEQGLPSDNPYSLNWNLSVGRLMGWDVQDVSVMLARTLFYTEICGEPTNKLDWHNRFSFIFGEGFGETGGLFHQVPYAREIRQYGFYPRIFGDFRNGRQLTTLLNAYTGSNFIEYLGHGDWFWFRPSIYGLDYYNKAVDVVHVQDWIFQKPSVFLTSSCLMGRVDGIPPNMNIGLTLLHAGANCFVGATRMTGSEAGLEPLENHLIVDDMSIGEALREEKRVDKELPTYYVRVLYGDPAFNPYEPNNGFSSQGRPSGFDGFN
jgi:hypothetical protein